MFADTNIMRFDCTVSQYIWMWDIITTGDEIKEEKKKRQTLADWRIRDLRCLVYIARALKLHHFGGGKRETAKSSAPDGF